MFSNTSRITLYFKEIEQCYLNVQKRLKTNLKPRRNLNSGCSSLFPRNLSRRSLCAVTDWKYQWILLATFHEHSTNGKASYAKPSLSRYSFSSGSKAGHAQNLLEGHVDFRRHSAATLQRSEFTPEVASLSDTSRICFSSVRSKEMQVFILLFLDFLGPNRSIITFPPRLF